MLSVGDPSPKWRNSTMRCPDCDEPLKDGAKFCHRCGAELDEPTPRRGLKSSSPLAESDEEVIWSGSFSAKGLIHSWLLATLITVVLPIGGSYVGADRVEWAVIVVIIALVWIVLGAILFVQKLNVHYELTNQRLIHRSGIFLRRTNRIELIDMDDISHEQGLIERFFDVGTIEISSSDRSHPLIQLPGINHVEEVAMLIDDARRRERLRRGIHIEQI